MNIFSRITRFIVPIITMAREIQRFNDNFEALMLHFGVEPPRRMKERLKAAKNESAVYHTDEDVILEDEVRADLGLPPRTRED